MTSRLKTSAVSVTFRPFSNDRPTNQQTAHKKVTLPISLLFRSESDDVLSSCIQYNLVNNQWSLHSDLLNPRYAASGPFISTYSNQGMPRVVIHSDLHSPRYTSCLLTNTYSTPRIEPVVPSFRPTQPQNITSGPFIFHSDHFTSRPIQPQTFNQWSLHFSLR